MSIVLRRLFLARVLRYRLASALSVLAIALGVALGLAVHLIHSAALDEFGRGMRHLSGQADLQLLGPAQGFAEDIYALLARRAEVAVASPVLQVRARLPGRSDSLDIHGVDLFRLQQLQSALRPAAAGRLPGTPQQAGEHRFAALQQDSIYLSRAARERLQQPTPTAEGSVGRSALEGEQLRLQSGLHSFELRVAGELPLIEGELAMMDIAAAQQAFDRIGLLSRVDLKLADGISPATARRSLGELLPPGLSLREPEDLGAETSALTRAYRVNLAMLAAIALLAGGFLVFATQLLAVARRRREFALLRALGLEGRSQLRGVLSEGLVVGALGAVLGIGLGYLLAAAAFAIVGADLGAGFFRGVKAKLQFAPLAVALHFSFGLLAGIAGSWLPARAATRVEPANALKAGESQHATLPSAATHWPLAILLAVLIVAACQLPAIGGLPLAAYVAIALSLVLAVLLLPLLTRLLLPVLSLRRSLNWRLARARLAAVPGQTVVTAAGVVVSVALAASMVIMVSSFRHAVDDWLLQILPGDLYVRAAGSSTTAFLDASAISDIAATTGVASVDSTRLVKLRLSAEEPEFSLLARPLQGNWGLFLVAGKAERPAGVEWPLWISEAAADRLNKRVGDELSLPLAGKWQSFSVVGIWRDYSRQHGAALIEPQDYVALTGDERVNDAAIRLEPGVSAASVIEQLQQRFGDGHVEFALPGEIRAATLQIFDRTFFITYLLEAVTVLIGLFGIATGFASLATAREAEFGMLRHLGFTRGELSRLAAVEGALAAAVGVVTGLLAGSGIAWILVEKVNRQSFHWSMDLQLPWLSLALFGLILVALAALVARLAASRTMATSALQAVKADW